MSMSTRDDRELKRHLKDIVAREITLNKEETKKNVQILNEVLEAVVAAMVLAEPLFESLYQRPGYSGSYYEGVRIHTPREFDLNLILSLPFKPRHVELIPAGDPADYMQLRLREGLKEIFRMHPKWIPKLYQKLESFFEGGYLVCDAVHRWMQSVTDKAMNILQKPDSVMKITYGKSGPGSAFTVTTLKGVEIDVDLVPVIDCRNLSDYSFYPGFEQTERFKELIPEAKMYFLIPKMGKPRGNSSEFETDSSSYGYGPSDDSLPSYFGNACSVSGVAARNWRVSFPEADKHLIHGMKSAKLLIKLFKLLRDRQRWTIISSYQIVNMFLLEVDKHPLPDYWDENNLGTLFMQMLKNWKDVIGSRYLPYYYARGANLLDKMKASTSNDVVNRMNKIITSITDKPASVLRFYQ